MRLQLLALLATCVWMHVDARSKYVTPEEDNPYEFGFTIDGQQHRHEKKDANGIIQGEFGFITADGVYHVTVYATDENGNYRVLSMRNVRISGPLDEPTAKLPDTSQFSKGQSVPNPNPLSIVTTPAPPQRVEVATQSNRFTTQSTIKPACAGCGYVTHATPLNAQKDGSLPFQTHAGQNPKPQDVIIEQKPVQQPDQGLGGVQPIVTSSSGFDVTPGSNAPFVSNPLGAKAVGQFNPENNYSSQTAPASPDGSDGSRGLGSNDNSPLNPNKMYNQRVPSNYSGNESGSKSEQSVNSSQEGNVNTDVSKTHQGQQPQQPPQLQMQQIQPHQHQLQQTPQPHHPQQPQLPPQSQSKLQLPKVHPQQPQQQQTLQSHTQQSQSLPQQPYQPPQNTPQLYQQPGQPQSSQSQPQQPNQSSHQGSQPLQTQTPQVSGSINAPESQEDPLLNPLSINNPQNHINQPSQPTSGITVSNGVINVPNNPPITIQDKYPNMVDGLPAGIKEGDITDLLYRFNYTVGFHGHYEKGYKNGAKVGGYFVTDRDGVSRVVTYVADENGYRPKVKFVRLDLTSDLVPKEGTEKTFGLKNFEFVWYPLK